MSDTFLIKKTAFDALATGSAATAQREANTLIIGPGEINGPGGVARFSDLTLFGKGAYQWGQGLNQDLYRLLENNACPQKVAGDNLPAGLGSPISRTVYQTGDPIMPKDEIDLGQGNGITYPQIGQTWFNTTDNIMYVYTYTGSPSALGYIGFLTKEYETTASNTFVYKSGDTMTGNLVFAGSPLGTVVLARDPSSNFEAATKQYVDAVAAGAGVGTYVEVAGSTMTGLLVLSGDPVVSLGAATKQYVDNVAANYVPKSGTTMTGLLVLSGNPVVAYGAATKQYADTKLSLSGGTLTGTLTLNADPVSALQAATKQYVDTTAASVTTDAVTKTTTNTIASSGVQSITNGAYWYPAAGVYNIKPNHSYLELQLYISGSGWVGLANTSGGGMVVFDGTNQRYYNHAGGTVSAAWQKF